MVRALARSWGVGQARASRGGLKARLQTGPLVNHAEQEEHEGYEGENEETEGDDTYCESRECHAAVRCPSESVEEFPQHPQRLRVGIGFWSFDVPPVRHTRTAICPARPAVHPCRPWFRERLMLL